MSAAYGNNFWGGIVTAPAAGEKLLRVRTGASELARLLEHWAKLPANERPVLHGISATTPNTGSPALELLLGQPNVEAFWVLEVSPAGSGFARPSALWPYGLWWEEELRSFGGVEFSGMIPERDAVWRPL